MPRSAIFLDRDDTLIRCNSVTPDGDLTDPGLVELMPGAAEALRSLRRAGYFIAVVTNQGAVARGKCSPADVERVNARVRALLPGLIDDVRFCPFHPQGVVPAFTREHPWRKPAPGMLLDLAAAHTLDLRASWMIGDAPRDIGAGRSAGCRTILVSHDRGAGATSGADAVVPDLAAAAAHILAHREGAPRP